MIVKRKIIVAALAVLIGGWAPVHAGGWTQKQGEGYYKIGARYLRADHSYDSSGASVSIPAYVDLSLTLYGEYGLLDRVTGILSLPFYRRAERDMQAGGLVDPSSGTNAGLGDAEIGVRFGIFQEGPTVLSAAVTLGAPFGEDMPGMGPPTGDGEFNQAVALQAGHSFHPAPLYASADIGINNRSGGFADQFLYGAELGCVLGDVSALVRASGVESLGNGDEGVNAPGLYSNNQRYLAIGFEAAYAPGGRFGIAAGIETATLARNTLAAPTYSLGVFLKI